MTDRVIRPSSLTTWADCGRRWASQHLTAEIEAAGYKLQIQRVTHVGAAIGSGVHAAASYTLEEKRRTGELGNDTEAEQRAVAEFEERAEWGLDWDDASDNVSVAKRQVARMTRSYRRYLAPEIDPIIIEQRLEANIAEGWKLSGQMDDTTGDPDTIIRDLKTGTRQRANNIQYGAYGLILHAHGYNVRGLIEDFIPRVKIKDEQPRPHSTEIPLQAAAIDAMETMEDIIRSTAEFERRLASQTGRAPHSAFRANPGSSLCSPRWCRAWGTEFCTAHRK